MGSKPISSDDYNIPDLYYDDSKIYADHIGWAVEDEEERHECIKRLADRLGDLFTLDGDVLVYKGKDAMHKFLQDWTDAIKSKTEELEADNVLCKLSNIIDCAKTSHKFIHQRFYIDEWNDWAGAFRDLVDYLGELKEGDRIYIGSIIDYHY